MSKIVGTAQFAGSVQLRVNVRPKFPLILYYFYSISVNGATQVTDINLRTLFAPEKLLACP